MWQPILSGELRDAARESIGDIASELLAMDSSRLSPIELCEHALLCAYLGLDQPSENWHDKCLDYLNLAIDRFSAAPFFRISLYGGMAGFGWMVQHAFSVVSGETGESEQQMAEDDDSLSELDDRIFNFVEQDNSPDRCYDLISGFAGIGIYWLERMPRQKALRGIRQILDAFERIQRNTPLGATWFTPPSLVPPLQIESAPGGYYNLGVAHGVPGVIAFLALASGAGIDEESASRASVLLSGAMKWLLAQQRPPDAVSRYSCWTMPGYEGGDSRLSWCYGDLGIASVLQLVAQRREDPVWAVEARSLTDRCILRGLGSVVHDAPLCHGAVGNAHLYNRAYQAYRDDRYKTEAIAWLERGIKMRKPGTGVAGYYAYDQASIPHEKADASFLSGAVGLALALLSAVAPIEPQWDRIMLLSGRQPIAN
jgi:lantibiotic modifying enzyme